MKIINLKIKPFNYFYIYEIKNNQKNKYYDNIDNYYKIRDEQSHVFI